MAKISGQLQEDRGNLSRIVGPNGETQSIYWRKVSTRVSYELAGVPYVDTLPAKAYATLYGSSPATIMVDSTRARHVTFSVPSRGGAGALYIAPAPAFNALAATTDVIPMELILGNYWEPYPAIDGPASAPPPPAQPTLGQSFSGGAVIGALDAQSVSGAAMGTIVASWGLDPGAGENWHWCEYLHVPAAPAADTALVTVAGPNGAYHRLRLTTGLHLVLESNVDTISGSLDIGAVLPGDTTWIDAAVIASNGSGYGFQLRGALTSAKNGYSAPVLGGASSPTLPGGSPAPADHYDAVSCTAGLGHDVTGAGLADMPANASWWYSKMITSTSGDGLFPPPLVDTQLPTHYAVDDYWTCRGTVGAITTLVGANGSTWTATGAGLRINTVGPYSSSGLSASWSNLGGTSANHSIGIYVRAPFAPDANTVLAAYYGAPGTYHRLSLSTNLHVILESSYRSLKGRLDLGPIQAGDETYIDAIVMGGSSSQPGFSMRGQTKGVASGPSTQVTGNYTDSTMPSYAQSYSSPTPVLFGLGHDVTGSGLADFPNATSWEMSKPVSTASNYKLFDPPLADNRVNDDTAADEWWLCRESVGPSATLTGYHGTVLVAGPQGLTVNAEGPYTS